MTALLDRGPGDVEVHCVSVMGDSLGDRAYREIWQRIIHLDYQPLEVLNEKELSVELGVGLSPVRQALRRLEYDGLVMILPRRGTLTTEVGLNAIQWELEIRAEIEGLGARLAAQRGSAREHEEMAEVVALMESATADGDDLPTLMHFTDLDSRLHRLVYQQTRNPSLIADLERHFAHALRIWFYCHRLQPAGDSAFSLAKYNTNTYRELVSAIAGREGERARELMQQHVRRDTEDALAMLRDLSPQS